MKQWIFLTMFVLLACFSACSSSGSTTSNTPAVSNAPPQTNPVPATPESIASGKKLFDKLCVECHGEKADGVSEVAAAMQPGEVKPPSLIDDDWDHGSTDNDIFVGIRDGVGGVGAMKGLNGRPGVGPNDMWNLVNYVRSLHVAK